MSDINNLITALTHLTQSQQQLVQALGQQKCRKHTRAYCKNFSTNKREPKENVVAWLLQVLTIFRAQGVTNEAMQVNYATTGLKDAALHWYLNKMVENNNVPPYIILGCHLRML